MAKKLHNRIKPALNICRLFGFGFQLDGSMIALTVDALLALSHLSFCIYGYGHVTKVTQERMPILWDITTVMSVVKVHMYLLTPPAMLVTWQCYKRTLTYLFCRLDEIIPLAETVPLRSYVWNSVTWLSLMIFVELFIFSMFHVFTSFVYFDLFEYGMIAIYITWSVLPILLYMFLIGLVCQGVRNVNDQITSIDTWRTYRSRWKELRYVAVRLAENEFGVMIVVFVLYTITEIVYFTFSLYFISYKNFRTKIIYYTVLTLASSLIILIKTFWLFQIVRVSQNCKSEMLRTQRILNSVEMNTESDFKEFKYTSLYMLHMDFHFMPCSIFELSYRNLLKIATLISLFVIFQIQMKLH